MTTNQQTQSQPAQVPKTEQSSDTLITIVGIFLVMILIWVTIKGKLRDWFIR